MFQIRSRQNGARKFVVYLVSVSVQRCSLAVCTFVWFYLFLTTLPVVIRRWLRPVSKPCFLLRRWRSCVVKVQSASIQYKDLPTLQWFSFTHNEVSPRFLVSSILLYHRMIGNTLLTPSIQPSSFGSPVFLRVPIRIPHGNT